MEDGEVTCAASQAGKSPNKPTGGKQRNHSASGIDVIMLRVQVIIMSERGGRVSNWVNTPI